jgi:hypothetical protein
MGRNYSLPTIKTLFAEASSCAYPGCAEPLIFRDRGVTTVVAQIAHIRSEMPNGPRHDAAFVGDIDGADNLLLLCGRHHPPVDRHESLYSASELLAWKDAQRAAAVPGGTPLPESEARTFVRLTDEERVAMAQIARLAERVVLAALGLRRALDAVEAGHEAARAEALRQLPPMWAARDDGSRTRITEIHLSGAEQLEWRQAAVRARNEWRAPVAEAIGALREEVAVLRMMGGGSMARKADDMVMAAMEVGMSGDKSNELLNDAIDEIRAEVADTWRVANGL